MNMPFDVGDKVTITLTGTLHRFEQAEGEDGCYTVYLEDDIYKGNDYTTRVYLYASTLEKMGAKKIQLMSMGTEKLLLSLRTMAEVHKTLGNMDTSGLLLEAANAIEELNNKEGYYSYD